MEETVLFHSAPPQPLAARLIHDNRSHGLHGPHALHPRLSDASCLRADCATFRWFGCTRVLAGRGSFRRHPSNSPSPRPFPATHGGNQSSRSSRISAESHIMPLWTLSASLVDGSQSDVLRSVGKHQLPRDDVGQRSH